MHCESFPNLNVPRIYFMSFIKDLQRDRSLDATQSSTRGNDWVVLHPWPRLTFCGTRLPFYLHIDWTQTHWKIFWPKRKMQILRHFIKLSCFKRENRIFSLLASNIVISENSLFIFIHENLMKALNTSFSHFFANYRAKTRGEGSFDKIWLDNII